MNVSELDPRCAKVVTDIDNRDRILLDGWVIALEDGMFTETNNEIVLLIVKALRQYDPDFKGEAGCTEMEIKA